jgi:SAM-dependent methyltransferase
MNENWKGIWNKRKSADFITPDLRNLIDLDGFDSGAGRVEVEDWQRNAWSIAQHLGLLNGDSVFEVGCGAGAFLYALKQGHTINVAGIDYSANLLAAAKKAIPEGDFTMGEAKDINPDTKYDFVISHSVFHYFSLDYANQVLELMIGKANKAVAILEVPDLNLKSKAESSRRNILKQEEYDKKYLGLEHTYYSQDWFKHEANRFGLECVFLPCNTSIQGKYRFNCIIHLKK